MRIYTLSLLLFLSLTTAFSQTENIKPTRQQMDLMNMARFQRMKSSISDSTVMISKVLDVPLKNITPFLAYSLTHNLPNHADEVSVSIRFSTDGKNWENWIPIHQDPHEEPNADRWVSELMFAKKETQYFQYRIKLNKWSLFSNLNLQLHLYSPGDTQKQLANAPERPYREPDVESRSCPCGAPELKTREEWCPSGDCPPRATPATARATHLIVHHSADQNTANDWAAVMRSIWNFHVNTRGWDDVGYNFLIDPNGVVYEARGANALGAHFCGTNTDTEGFCLLGTYTEVPPTDKALKSLKEMLAWRACARNINPTGFSFHTSSGLVLYHISGHRDGCSTECPGEKTYELLPQLRLDVAQYINTSCSGLPGPGNLTAERLTDTTAFLKWGYFGSPTINIAIERAPNAPENFEEIAFISTMSSNYTDSGLDPVTDYYYRIRAASPTDTSLYTEPVLARSLLTGTENPFLNTGTVRLFPNPFKSDLTVQIDNELTGRIEADLIALASGQVLRTYQWDKPTAVFRRELQLDELPSGLYILHIKHEQARAGFKLVKQ